MNRTGDKGNTGGVQQSLRSRLTYYQKCSIIFLVPELYIHYKKRVSTIEVLEVFLPPPDYALI